MKEGDIIVGNFSGIGEDYLTYYTYDDNYITPYIELWNNSYYQKGCLGISGGFKAKRLATTQEQAQLLACIKANKFIPLDKINQQFKTYI